MLPLHPGDPHSPMSSQPPQGPHLTGLSPCLPAQGTPLLRVCVEGSPFSLTSLFSLLLETNDLAVHKGLCLKDTKMWAVREPDHKWKYLQLPSHHIDLRRSGPTSPPAQLMLFPCSLGQLVNSYSTLKTQLPCPSPTMAGCPFLPASWHARRSPRVDGRCGWLPTGLWPP